MSEQLNEFTCHRCGWTWLRGQDGNHDCLGRVTEQRDAARRVAFQAQEMAKEINAQREALQKERDELQSYLKGINVLFNMSVPNDMIVHKVAVALSEKDKALEWGRAVIENNLGESIRGASRKQFEEYCAAISQPPPGSHGRQP